MGVEVMVKKVSVIIPTFNSENIIRKLIRDLELQTYKNIEVIFVDDQSTDHTLEILESHTNFIVKSIQHAGQSVARNYGMNIATGDYIMFIDSDDRVHPKYIERLVSVINQEDADIVECRYIVGYKEDDYKKLKDSENFGKILKDNVFELLSSSLGSNVNSVPVWNKIYKKELIYDVRFLTGNNQSEDLWFNIKVFAKANKVVRISDELYFYFQHPNSALHKRVSHKDMEILETHKLIVSFVRDIYGDSKELELANIKFIRTYYSLLLRCLRNKTNIDFSENDFDILKKGVVVNFKLLVHSPMKLSRKLALLSLFFLLKVNMISISTIR